MAYDLATIPDDKFGFYRGQLIREVSNLFEWSGMPDEIPLDYVERVLITEGKVMFFYDPSVYGYMALACGVRGYNIYNKPTVAYAIAPNMEGIKIRYERIIVYQYNKNIDPEKGCVLINNMYGGQSLLGIIDFYGRRLAMIQQAFDTNALWQNIPVLFPVPSDDVKLSIEKLFQKIYSGRPWVIVDELLAGGEKPVQGLPIDVPYRLDVLMDSLREVKQRFYETIGINTPGADKKERLLEDEVNANEQALDTALKVMLNQRKKACKEINKLFGLNVDVRVREHTPENYIEEDNGGGEPEDGGNNN